MSRALCRIATRRSPLAVCQAQEVAAELERAQDIHSELVRIETQGDQMLEHPLATTGGKGLFLRELEHSLLRGDTDLAVHSLKDVPAEMPEGLELIAICQRADARDAIIAPQHRTLEALPKGSRVGTSSLRRQAQLRAQFPELEFIDLRGNVNTRLKRLDEGHCKALVLACAGLQRLGLADRITQILEPEQCLPAIGQGALTIEAASTHPNAREWVRDLHHAETFEAVTAERALSHALFGSCQLPLAAHATWIRSGHVSLQARLANRDGSRMLHAQTEGAPSEAGAHAAQQLLDQGGREILTELGISLPS